MSTEIKMASPFLPLSSLPYLRTTGFRTFQQCQHTWALNFLMPDVNTDNKWSKIGTAAHYVVEHTLRASADMEHASDEEIAANFLKVPEEERDALSWYVEMLLQLDYKRIVENGIEYEFQIDVEGVDKKIKGTLDLILELEDGSLMIVDHKTNRTFEGLNHWKADIQPLIYSLAMRRLFPGRKIFYKLGYINLSREMGTVDWETDPSEDEHVEEHIRRCWKDMVHNEWRGFWPMSTHDDCKYCPLYKAKTCVEHNGHITSLPDQMRLRMSTIHPMRKIEMLKTFTSYAEDMIAEEKLKFQEMLQNASDGKLVVGETEYRMEPYSERFINPNDAMSAISTWLSEQSFDTEGDPMTIVGDVVPLLFSAKVGGLDKIETINPRMGELLKSVVGKRDYDPRLKTRKLKPSEIAKKAV